jgi:L-amino acid N-acyltransferase YncA
MELMVRRYTQDDLDELTAIWNSVVEGGIAFPQDKPLDSTEAERFFAGQSFTGVADDNGEIAGLYILHPNNVGRCGHIANASYAVREGCRGKHIGEKLVRHSMETAASLSFRVLQFNAVVASNKGAIHLYKKLGFTQLGVIPGGFRMDDGTYADILPFYITL